MDGEELSFDAKAKCKGLEVRKQEVEMCQQFNVTVPFNTNFTEIHNATVLLVDHKPEAPHPTASISDGPCDDTTYGAVVVVPPSRVVDVWYTSYQK